MLRLIGLGVLAFSMALAGGAADDAAIRGVVKTYLDAREQRNDSLLAAVFTADADQLVSSGQWRRGRAALVEGTLASSAREAGKRTVKIETIRYLSKDVAIADGRYVIAGVAEDRRMWSTFVMKREAGGWKIAAIRNMMPAMRQ